MFYDKLLAKKSVRFPHYTHNDTRSIGAKSAPVINRRSDNETEPSDDEQVTSDNSSQESGSIIRSRLRFNLTLDREQVGNASFLNDLKMISEDKEQQQQVGL